MNLKWLQATDWSSLKATEIINTVFVLISNTVLILSVAWANLIPA